jgi:hypothetical protein
MKHMQESKKESKAMSVRIVIEYDDDYVTDMEIVRPQSLEKVEKDKGILGKLVREEIDHV